jgi:hypothetical protein
MVSISGGGTQGPGGDEVSVGNAPPTKKLYTRHQQPKRVILRKEQTNSEIIRWREL